MVNQTGLNDTILKQQNATNTKDKPTIYIEDRFYCLVVNQLKESLNLANSDKDAGDHEATKMLGTTDGLLPHNHLPVGLQRSTTTSYM